ncbi:MAG: hypothetical protein ACK6AD_06430 [Cyanobacteriota bacterium]
MANSFEDSASPLAMLAGSVGLLAIALFFTGWMYRWHYYTFFQVEPTSLGLSVESTIIAAYAVLMGSPWAIVRLLLGLVLIGMGIALSFRASRSCRRRLLPRLRWLAGTLGLSEHQQKQLLALASLVDELVIMLWLLFLLQGLAGMQGLSDARRDAVNETSTLPVITMAMTGREAVIGRDLDQLLANPQGVRLLGSRERYEALLGSELNGQEGRATWRLLSDAGGQLLVIPSLPAAEAGGKAPPVLLFPEGGKGDRLLLLSPAQQH